MKNIKIGYVLISKSDGSQSLDLQLNALTKDGVVVNNIYGDQILSAKEKERWIKKLLKSFKKKDSLIEWKFYRLKKI